MQNKEAWKKIKESGISEMNEFVFIYNVNTKQAVMDCKTEDEFNEFCKTAPKGTYRLIRNGCSLDFDNEIFPKVERVIK